MSRAVFGNLHSTGVKAAADQDTLVLVNSRSPEALISHDSAPMQSTSVAAQFLTIQAFSRKCPIGHALDISFENWTSSLRIYIIGFVESHARLHLAVGLTSAFVIVSRPLHQLLSHEPVQFLRIRRMPTPLDLSAEILAIAVWTTASSTRRWPPISSTRRMRR